MARSAVKTVTPQSGVTSELISYSITDTLQKPHNCVELGQHDINNRRAKEIFAEVKEAVLSWPEFAKLSGVSEETVQWLLSCHR